MTENTTGRRPRVLVGVDGSAPARAALEFAVGEARLRDAVLVAVMAVQFPDYAWIDPYGTRSHPEEDTLQRAREKLDRMLASVDTEGLALDPVVTAVPAPQALVDRSADCRPAGGRVSWPRRVPRPGAGLGEHAVRAARALPRHRRPRRAAAGRAAPPPDPGRSPRGDHRSVLLTRGEGDGAAADRGPRRLCRVRTVTGRPGAGGTFGPPARRPVGDRSDVDGGRGRRSRPRRHA